MGKAFFVLVLFLLFPMACCYAETANKGVDYYNKVIVSNPQNAEAYRQRGLAYELEHNTTKAMIDYNKGIQINPKVALLYWNRGLLSYKIEDYDQAIIDFSKYLQSKPNSPLTLLMRGQAYYKKGDYDLAVSDFYAHMNAKDEVGKWGPYFAYLDLSWVYLKKKDYDKAWEFARKAVVEESINHPNSTQSTIGLSLSSELIAELRKVSGREK